MNDKCFNCNKEGSLFHGFIICESCKMELRLFTDKTINRHIQRFTKSEYKQDLTEKLTLLEKTYVKKKIKLLDILSRID